MSMAECRLYDKITNCAMYGSFTSFTSPANDQIRYGCSQCINNYYLNPVSTSLFTITGPPVTYISDSCIVRTYLDTNCILYKASEDKCDTCAYGYYLDTTSGKCKQSPSGILNCQTYQNAFTCSACQGDYYLINNQCLAVGTPVSNCSHYKADSICDACSTGAYIDTV